MSMTTNSDTKSNQGMTDIGSASGMENKESSVSLWRETIKVSIAKSRKVRGGNFVQISTVDPETLEPRIRTVVFRGFLSTPTENDKGNDPFIMKMITDLRSSKVHEITKHSTSKAELLWWFSKSSEQYRVLGTLKFVGSGSSGLFDLDSDPYYQQARKQQWGNLSDSAREQFYWRDPKTSYETQSKVPEGGRDEEGKVLPPPDNFLLMLLFPERVDFLRLGDNYRQVDELTNNNENEEGKWVMERVNP